MERIRISARLPASRWRRVATVALLLLLASVVPSPLRRRPEFSRFGPDKLLHLLGHAGFTVVLSDALAAGRRDDRRAALLSIGVSTGYSLLTGHLQRRVPGRVPERADVVAAALGSVLGVLAWRSATEGTTPEEAAKD